MGSSERVLGEVESANLLVFKGKARYCHDNAVIVAQGVMRM